MKQQKERIEMSKFYLPGLTPEETEILYPFLRQKAQYIALQITERKIESLLYKRRGKLFFIKVGNPDPIKGEIVIAIFEASVCFMVFTPNRGVSRGDPFVTGKNEVLAVEEFEDS
jgi:hypothetical protein